MANTLKEFVRSLPLSKEPMRFHTVANAGRAANLIADALFGVDHLNARQSACTFTLQHGEVVRLTRQAFEKIVAGVLARAEFVERPKGVRRG